MSKNFFEKCVKNCNKYFNKGHGGWRNWAIFYFISPLKVLVLLGILITLLVCGVGFYGLLVLILLGLLFIFVP